MTPTILLTVPEFFGYLSGLALTLFILALLAIFIHEYDASRKGE